LLTVLAIGGLALFGLDAPANASEENRMNQVIPAPVSVTPDRHGGGFELSRDTAITVDRGARGVGEFLAGVLRPSTGYRLPVVTDRRSGAIALTLGYVPSRLGNEGYQLTVNRQGVTLKARTSAGLFSGVQTLRQLLPAKVESRARQRGPWSVPAGTIVDYPRFAYRGAMLDVARHFFTPTEVKRYIDQIALYKVNHLHLHLAGGSRSTAGRA
jgi:hexosaminidase